ncbi:MAG: hypothetical protein ACOYW3_01445 [Bacteroidota bacterium]
MINFILLIVFSSFTLLGFAQDDIEWSETRKLTVNDFKGSRPEDSPGQTLAVSFGMEVKLNKSTVQQLTSFNGQVANLFSAAHSWIDWTDQSRLRYAITLFDLNEWTARELRKRLNNNRQKVLAGQHAAIQDEVRKEFEAIRQQYDSESNFGNDPAGQLNWERRIAENLAELSEYCKLCGGKK